MKKNKGMRVLCICLAAIMCVTMSGISAYAIGEGTDNLTVQNAGEATLTLNGTLVKDVGYNLSASWTMGGATSYTVQLDGTTVEENYTQNSITFEAPIAFGQKCKVTVTGDNGTTLTKGFMSTDVTGTSSDGVVYVNWRDIEDVSEYKVSAYDSNKTFMTQNTVKESNTTSFTGLETGKEYTFVVKDGSGTYESTESAKIRVIGKTDPSGKITGLKTYSDYKSVTLEWDFLTGATGYNIYQSEKKNDGYKLVKQNKAPSGKEVESYRCKNLEEATNYYFKVSPVFNGVEGTLSEPVKDQCVRPMYIYVRSKQTKTLTSHDGDNAKYTVHSGEGIETFGFGSGKYRFYMNGHLFYITRISTSEPSAQYTKKWNYSDKEAELFINHKNISTSKKYIMWTSFYCQHLYIFKKFDGEWKVYKDWEISTGCASTPSPTGNKQIGQKIRYRHNLPYWSCYSTLNAFHGAFSSWVKKLGNPKSGGCIRNKNENAKWIYYNVSGGSKVLNF